MERFRSVSAILGVLALGTIVSAQGTTARKPVAQHDKHVLITPDEVKWGPPPAGLPAGSQLAVLAGDPTKAGNFIIRAKLPDGYKVPPHWHPTDEHLTVISGSMLVGMGDKFDESTMQTMTAGAYAKMPRRSHHYVLAKGETILQISGAGPFAITYVNPSDDPRKKTTTSGH